MVHYNSKIVCVSVNEIYSLGIRFTKDNGNNLEISNKLKEYITESVKEVVAEITKPTQYDKRGTKASVSTYVADYGVGILVGCTENITDTRTLTDKIAVSLYLQLVRGKFAEIVGDELTRYY